MRTKILVCTAFTIFFTPGIVFAADYIIDQEGQHAFVSFKASHLGYSYIVGNFTRFNGSFTYEALNPSATSVNVIIEAQSIDSNHAERDKHFRGPDYFDVSKYPVITFKSTAFEGNADAGNLHGNLSLHGVSKPIVIAVKLIGEGKDPWGGYRSGFEGKVTLNAADFNMPARIGKVEVDLIIEGIRQ